MGYVTQPTLSMQILKLEEELIITFYNRRIQPIVHSTVGKKVIEQATIAIRNLVKINEHVKMLKNEIRGNLKLVIIPYIIMNGQTAIHILIVQQRITFWP